MLLFRDEPLFDEILSLFTAFYGVYILFTVSFLYFKIPFHVVAHIGLWWLCERLLQPLCAVLCTLLFTAFYIILSA